MSLQEAAGLEQEAAERVLTLVTGAVAQDCVSAVRDEFKKDFVFAKKSSRKPPKRRTKKNSYLSRKEKRELGFYKFPRSSVRYADVEPMHQIWCDYMTSLLELDRREPPSPLDRSWELFAQSIYKADFHGSKLRVVRSKCSSYVDKSGICVMDTRHTFKVVSEKDITTTIPKKESVFEMSLNKYRIVFFGKHLCVRPAERSVKKIKCQQLPDL